MNTGRIRAFVTATIIVMVTMMTLFTSWNNRPAFAAGTITVNHTADDLATDDNTHAGQCSLRLAINLVTDGTANNCGTFSGQDTIKFNGSGPYFVDTLHNGGFIQLNPGAQSLTTLTVDGGSGAIIDGGSAADKSGNSLIIVATPSGAAPVITFQNLTFRNAITGGAGGVFTINGGNNIFFYNDTFTGNQADSDGGAIDSSGSTLTIVACSFSSNSAGNGAGGGNGGAILSSGAGTATLIMAGDSFSSNTAANNGGAIHNTGSIQFDPNPFADYPAFQTNPLFLLPGLGGSSFSTNVAKNTADSADGGGGAIFNGGALSVFATSFSANVAGLPGVHAGFGGAISSISTATKTDIYDSAILSNVANDDLIHSTKGKGGGIYTEVGANIVRDTISLNAATSGLGEAVYTRASGADIVIGNSSFNGNNTLGTGTVIENNNGNLKLVNDTIAHNLGIGVKDDGSGASTVVNTILSNNGTNCAGTVTSLGHNLNDNDTGCSFGAAGDIPNTDPRLDAFSATTAYPFQFAFTPHQGGPNPSPAINAGSNSVCNASPILNGLISVSVDQRGAVAFPSFTRPKAPNCTIGAIEVGLASPSITKAFGPSTIAAGDTSTITFTLTNPNYAALTNGSFSDALLNMSLNGAQTVGGTCIGTNPSNLTGAENPLSFTGITIPGASTTGSCTVTVVVTSSHVGINPNGTSGVTTNEVAAGSGGSDQLTVNPKQADLSITKTDGSPTYTAGAGITYTIVVTNAGPDAVTGATVTDTPPSSITGVSWTCTASLGSSCTASGTNTINDPAVNLLLNGTATYTLLGTVAPGTTGNLVNPASVAAPGTVTDPTPGNNSVSDTDTQAGLPQADLSITKTDGSPTYTAGAGITYTIVVTNAGPAAVTGATVTDTPPGSITGVSWTCAASVGSSCTASGTNTINDPAVSLLANGTATYTLLGTVAPGTTGNLVNPASVAAPGTVTDPTPGNNSVSDTDTQAALPQADLSITKTDGSPTYTAGAGITYTIVVTNAGPAAVTGATVTDTPPGSITGVSWTCTASLGSSCTASGTNTINDPAVNLLLNGTATYTLLGTVAPGTTGNLVNPASVAAPGTVTDPTPGNNSVSDTDTQAGLPQADLSITKTDGSPTYTAGAGITYTIVVTNAGPAAVTGATVTDTPPGSITGVSWTCAASVGSSCTASGTNTINDAAVNLLLNGTATYTLLGTVAPGTTGNLVNPASVAAPGTVTDPTPGNNSVSDTDTQAGLPQADLSITKTDGSPTYTAGAGITYTIVVTNAGPAAVTGATVTDTPPGSITGVSWTCAASVGSSCTASGTNTINDPAVNLLLNGTATYTLLGTVAPGTTGNLVNPASVAAPGTVTDPTPGNNSVSDTDTQAALPQADLSITKTDGSPTYTAGAGITYTIVVTNAGPAAVTGATVTDTPPGSITGVSWTCAASVGSSCTASGTNTINDAAVNLLANGTATYTLLGTVAPGTTGNLVNPASVAAPGTVTDPTPGNNSVSDTDTQAALPQADLSITKTDGSPTYTAGAGITYTIVVTNAGPAAVTGATVTDTPPGSITGVSWTCAASLGSSCTASGTNTINDPAVNLLLNGTATYTLLGTVAPGTTGNLVNPASVAAPGTVTDPTPGNNSVSDTDTQAGLLQADLSITKTDGSPTYTAGAGITYTIVVTNAGPAAVTGATVTDTPPGSITGVSWTCTASLGSSCTASGTNTINDAAVNLLLNGTATYTLLGTVAPGTTGNLVNPASVAAPGTVTDPIPGNNSVSDTDTQAALPQADLSITKSDGSAIYTPGGPITYSIVVTNGGPSAVTGATVTDTPPGSITGVSWTCAASVGSSCTASGTNTINDPAVNLLLNGTATYTLLGTVAPGTTGSLVNPASVAAAGTVTDPNPANNSATDTDTQAGVAVLTKIFNPSAIKVGTNSTLTFTLTNPAGNPALASLTFTDILPSGVKVASTAVTSQCNGGFVTATANTDLITLSGGSLPAGLSKCTVVVTVTSNTAGTYHNIATNMSGVSANLDASGINATLTVTTTNPPSATAIPGTPQVQVADPAFVKLGNPDLALPGENVTFTMTVTNKGTAAATGVLVTDTVPAQFTVITVSGSQGSHTVSGNTLTFNIGTLNPGQTVTMTILTKIHSDVKPPATLVNTAIMTYNGGAPRSSSATIRITGGQLPATGEHPGDAADPTLWLVAASVMVAGVVMLLASAAVWRRRKSSI